MPTQIPPIKPSPTPQELQKIVDREREEREDRKNTNWGNQQKQPSKNVVPENKKASPSQAELDKIQQREREEREDRRSRRDAEWEAKAAAKEQQEKLIDELAKIQAREQSERIDRKSIKPVENLQKYDKGGGKYDVTSIYREQGYDAVADNFGKNIANKVRQNEIRRQDTIDKAASKMPTEKEKKDIVAAQSLKERGLDVTSPLSKADRQYITPEVLAQKGRDFAPTMQEVGRDMWQNMTPWEESKGETATIGGSLLMGAELIAPYVNTITHWDDMSPAERALWIGIDTALIALPVAGRALGAAKAVGTAGKAARLAAVGRALKQEALMTARAPIDLALHPLESGKAGINQVRNLVENFGDPRKLPEAVITTSEGTVRLKVSQATSEAEALVIRDKLMEMAAKGEKPIINTGGVEIELTQSPLMKELKGGLAHSTPQGEAFEGGLKVATKKGMPASEQGLFVSHEPLPRFTTSSAFGKTGEQPAIIITSRETAQKAISSGKIYDSPVGKVAEMEKKFAVGTELPPPNQRLYTRVGPTGQRVEIWLEKPLTARQIAKLKLESLTEPVRGVFREPIRIKGSKGAGLIDTEIEDLVKFLRRTGNADQARQLERAARLAESMRRNVPTLSKIIGKVTDAELARARETIDRQAGGAVPVVNRVTPRDDKPRRDDADSRGRTEIPTDSRGRTDTGEDTRGRADTPEDSRGRTSADDSRGRTEPEPKRRDTPPRDRAEREEPRRTDRTPDAGRTRDDTPRREDTPPRNGERPRPETTPGRTPRIETGRTPDTTPAKRQRQARPVSQEKAKEMIDRAGGAIAWRMGQVGGKDRWDVVLNPYSSDPDYVMVLGHPPVGATILRQGPGSAYGTAQTILGKGPTKEFSVDSGAFDVLVKPAGHNKVKVAFRADPKGKTRSDIQAGRGKLSKLPKIKVSRGM